MRTKKTINITLAIFIGLVAGVLFGLFMPGQMIYVDYAAL